MKNENKLMSNFKASKKKITDTTLPEYLKSFAPDPNRKLESLIKEVDTIIDTCDGGRETLDRLIEKGNKK